MALYFENAWYALKRAYLKVNLRRAVLDRRRLGSHLPSVWLRRGKKQWHRAIDRFGTICKVHP